MKARVRLVAFLFLAAGLLGLLLNEFAFHWGTAATIAFAAVELIGFGLLAAGR